ncbi:MAG: hypothetical protein IJ099_06580 [Alphaproteobacteria bacterium]|nr:hypothetical protein [Alphaproteobacteria bacterium]
MMKCGKFEELEAQVFNQTLGGEGTFTAVLNEDEEHAVAFAILGGNPAAKRFFLKYMEHYTPFNTSVQLMIEHINPEVPDVLLKIIKRWGINPDIYDSICQLAYARNGEQFLPLVAAIAEDHRMMQANPELLLWLEKIDAKYEEKYAETYLKGFAS